MESGNSKDIINEQNYRKIFQVIIEILAVQVSEFRQTDLIDCMNRLGYRDERSQLFSYKTIRPLLAALKKNAAIIQNEKGIACRDDSGLEIIEQLVTEDRYKTIAAAVLASVSLFKPALETVYVFNDIKEFYRAIWIAVYTDEQYADLDLVCRSGNRNKKFWTGKIPPLLRLFAHPFRPGLIDRIPLPLRWKVLGYILDDAQKKMMPVPEILAHGISLLSEFPGSDEEYRFMDHLFLTGRMRLHRELLSGFKNIKTVNHLVQLGKSALVCENNAAALIFFNHALTTLEKVGWEQPYPIEGDNLFFLLLGLLGSEDEKDLYSGIHCIHNLPDSRECDEPSLVILIKALLPLFHAQIGKKSDPKLFPEYIISMQDPKIAFFSILILSWYQESRINSYIGLLQKIREQTMDCGYDWLSAEICALLARLGIEKDVNAAKAQTLHETMGTKSIVNLFKPFSNWKKALLSMVHMGEHTENDPFQPDETLSEQRLVWQLKYDETSNRCDLTPRFQKQNKKGTWTKGKTIHLETLQDTYLKLDWLTAQDRSVCAAIGEERRHHRFRFYHETDVRLDMEKALPALVGHPLIFLENEYYTPVEFVKGSPTLRLRSIDKRIHVCMEPRPADFMNFVSLLRETATRFKVVCFSTDHINLSRLVGEKGLTIPKKESKQVGQAIASVSSFITVVSDMEAEGIQTILSMAADAGIHVHLVPWLAGIKMEILVRPLGQMGSYFRPAKGGSHVLDEIDGKKVRVVRDMALEKNNEKKIIDACPTLKHLEAVGGEWMVGEPEQALELLLELKTCKEQPILKWPRGKKIKLRHSSTFSDFALSFKKDREWFKATGKLMVDDDMTVDLFQLMALLESSTGRFVTLDDGTFLAITRSLKDRLEELKAYSTPHGNGLRFSPLAAPAMEELMDQAGSLESDDAWKSHCRKLKETIQPKIPDTLQARLRDYQITGFDWLCRLAHWNVGGCLADDMGLGKTVQSLAAILVHAAKGPTLVVAPLSVMNNWTEECQKFAPSLNPLILGGKNRQQILEGLEPYDLVICSYSLLPIEVEKLSGVDWQTVVLDEAQAIKNRKTKRSKAAMRLNAGFRLITTGTPVENCLDELWTLFNFLNPGLLGTYNRFRQMFVVPIEGYQDKAASQHLRKLIRPFILRRMKTEVLTELPEKTEITLQVEMSHDEALLYEAQRLKSLESIHTAEDSPGQKQFRILAELTRLRQLCCNPSLVLPDAHIKSSKLKVFMDTVRELLENQHKALVFSQFVGHLAILRKALDRENISYQYLDGSTSVKNRKNRINDFQNGCGDFFLISLKAGGTGLNLTAADYVIHMDPWWNPAVEDQASDRAHRIGQTRPVTVYRLVVKDTIEERIVDLHQEKRDLAESLLAGSETAGKLSASELLALMQGKKADQ